MSTGSHRARTVPQIFVSYGRDEVPGPCPTPQQLPDALAPLAGIQTFELTDRRWRADMHVLLGALERQDLDTPQQLSSTSGSAGSNAPGRAHLVPGRPPAANPTAQSSVVPEGT